MATVREIAEMAKVSRGTVDRVINRRGKVKPETEKRVLAAIEKTGFVPDALGKALARKNRGVRAGIILNSLENPFFDEVKRGIADRLEVYGKFGFKAELRETRGFCFEDFIAETRNLSDCDLIIASAADDESVKAALNDTGKKIITVNSDAELDNKLAFVGCDYYQSGLISGGLAALCFGGAEINAAVIIGSAKSRGHTERAKGFENALKEQGCDCRISEIAENGDDDALSYERVKKLLKAEPRINCLYFGAGGVRGGVEAALESRKPVKIFTCDLTDYIEKRLLDGTVAASVTQQPYEQGTSAVAAAFDYLFEGRIPEKYVCVKNEIVTRYTLNKNL